ncbi:MAG: four helix bundle protein [Gelidibacter sp.]
MYQLIFQNHIEKEDIEIISRLLGTETQTWFEFSLSCNYINQEIFDKLTTESIAIGKLINYMVQNPDKFGAK